MRRSFIFLLLLTILFSPSIRGFFCSEISQASLSNHFLPPRPNDGIAVVVTLDGTMHLVDRVSRKVHWSLASGRPIYSSYQAFHDRDNDKLNASGPNTDLYVDCGDDLQLYVHSWRQGRLKKLELSAEEYVRRTPYIAEDGGITLGVKKTTVYFIDANSGRIIQTYRLDDPPSTIDVQNNAGKTVLWAKDAKALVESSPVNSTTVQQLVYIMRTDYVLQYYSPNSAEVLWNLAFAKIDAEFRCQESEKKLSVDYLHDSDLQLPCQMRPVVIQIRDHKLLESLPVFGWLDGIIPLPALNQNPHLPPAEILPLQNPHLPPADILPLALPNDKARLALPASEMENPLMLDNININITRRFHMAGSSIQSFVAFFATLLTIIGLAFYRLKQDKGSKQDQEFKLQVVHKKKKPKRSGNSKNSANNEKRKKLVSEGNEAGKTNRLPYNEGNEGKSLLTITDLVDGRLDGCRIGKLHVYNKEIAKGSNGTIVLEGIYDGRPVAVKRLVQTHHDVALKEIQNLIASDQHPNIVRWYGVEFDQDFIYLSLERCTCNLNDLIYVYSESFQNQAIDKDEDSKLFNEYNVRLRPEMENNKDIELWKPNGCPSPHLLKLMIDIVSGLAHLHELGIIHRDLKPQNVLIIKERSLCAKLSDMGISKRLIGDMSSLTRSATGYGSSGWQAPEHLRQGRQTRAVDLFSLGCVLFFCITGGKHPYGDSIERDVNIVNDRKDLFLVESIPEAMDLFCHLLDPNPEMRPKAQEVLQHPFFWSSEMRLSFLQEASDHVELEDRKSESELLNALESIAAVALDGKWDEKMETAFINNIGQYRRYNFESVRDLLRVIRNKSHHYRELPQDIQELLGPVPEGYEGYFSSRFPKLLIEVYKVLYKHCKGEKFFQKYIKSNLI
ncbi:serine/threonine-protein kinase/endoribonuclease IRE1b-like [Durio zibethinus]|uniref:non-specific serine/threonine protein kinase n=1 Tax=Durio zibethinus TaxID=66656 RepID=A0A6P6AXA0_DURZI|nr:serine/threonine-protein kinase/endoribonuclease IRE1b-like [Durio zibethinus]